MIIDIILHIACDMKKTYYTCKCIPIFFPCKKTNVILFNGFYFDLYNVNMYIYIFFNEQFI